MAYSKRRRSYRARGPKRQYVWHRQSGTVTSSSTANDCYTVDLLWWLRNSTGVAVQDPFFGPRVIDPATWPPHDPTGHLVKRVRVQLAFGLTGPVASTDPAPWVSCGVHTDIGPTGEHVTVWPADPGSLRDPSDLYYMNKIDWLWWYNGPADNVAFAIGTTNMSSFGSYSIDTRCVRKIEDRGDTLDLEVKSIAAGVSILYASSVLLQQP